MTLLFFCYIMNMGMYHMAYEHHILFMTVWLVFWLVIIAGLFLLVRSFLGKKGDAEKKAMDILDERYARGEINKEEYLEKKKDLSGR